MTTRPGGLCPEGYGDLRKDSQYAGELSVDSLVLCHLTLRQRVHHGVGSVVVIAQHVPVHVVHELSHLGIGPVDFSRFGGCRGHGDETGVTERGRRAHRVGLSNVRRLLKYFESVYNNIVIIW